MRLQSKLTLGIAFAMMTLLVINLTIIGLMITTMLNKRVIEQELPATLGEVRGEIGALISQPIQASTALAQNTFLIEALENGESQESQQAIVNHLDSVLNNNQASAAFLVSDLSSNYYTADGLLKQVSQSNDRDQWFYNFLNGNHSVELNFDVDENTGIPTIFVNVKVVNGDRVVAVAGIGKSLEKLTQAITDYKVGENGTAYLVNQQGNIQIHSSLTQQVALANVVGDAVANELLKPGEFHHSITERNGESFIVASTELPNTQWRIIVELPEQEVFGELYTTLVTLIIVSLLVGASFVLAMAFYARRIVKPIKHVAQRLTSMAQEGGDLTQRLEVATNDELGELASGFNAFVNNLGNIIDTVRQTNEQLNLKVDEIDRSMSQINRLSSDQEDKTDQVAVAMSEMETTVKEIAHNANETATGAATANESTQQNRTKLQQAEQSMQSLSNEIDHASQTVSELADKVQGISSVIETIEAISEQTNLLALNAAIESARAGEAGRGFAVVADEVRTLARKTNESTERVREQMAELRQSAADAVKRMQHSRGDALSTSEHVADSASQLMSLVALIQQTADMSTQIATATEQQASVSQDVAKNIQSIADFSREVSAAVGTSHSDCQHMNEMARHLAELLSQFKTR